MVERTREDRTATLLMVATLVALAGYATLILGLPAALPHRAMFTDTAYVPFHALAMLLLLSAARRADGRRRQGLMLLTASQALGTLNAGFWVLNSAGLLAQDAPVFEYVGLAMTALSVAGVVVLVPPRGIAGRTVIVPTVDAGLLALASISIGWQFVGAPMLAAGVASDRDFLGFAVIAAADLFTALFALGAWVFPSGRLRPASALLLSVSFVLSAWLDVVIEQGMLQGGYASGQPLDIVFAIVIVPLCAVGYLERLPAAPQVPDRARRVALVRLLLPFAAAVAVVVSVMEEAIAPATGPTRFVPWVLLLLFIALVQWRYVLLEKAAEADLTERMSLERNLRLSQQFESLGRYAASVAHDMNNLLAAVLAQVQLMRYLGANNAGEEATALLAETEKTLGTGTTLVRRLMQMSHGGETPEVSVDLTRATRNFAVTVSHLLPPNVRLKLDLPGDPMLVTLRPGDVDQVLLNLVVNARDACPDGGHITVRIRAVSGMAELEVIDDGAGISPEIVPHIFEPFFTTKTGHGGTGLGLATVQSIMTQSGGSIDVSSTPAHGTHFTVRWPIAG